MEHYSFTDGDRNGRIMEVAAFLTDVATFFLREAVEAENAAKRDSGTNKASYMEHVQSSRDAAAENLFYVGMLHSIIDLNQGLQMMEQANKMSGEKYSEKIRDIKGK